MNIQKDSLKASFMIPTGSVSVFPKFGFSNSSVGTSSPINADKPVKILASLDIDGTLLPKMGMDAYMKTQEFTELQEIMSRYSDWLIVMLNTGRKLPSVQELIPFILALNIEIAALGLRDGKEIVWKPQGQTTQQWLAELATTDSKVVPRDQDYKDYIWQKPVATVQSILSNAGYRYAHQYTDQYDVTYDVWNNPENSPYSVHWKSSEVYFRVLGDATTTQQGPSEEAAKLSNQIADALNVPIEGIKRNDKGNYTDVYIPVTHKKLASDYVREKLGEQYTILEEIRAGDAGNDHQALADPDIYAIRVGRDSKLGNVRQARGRGAKPLVREKTLASGINRQMKHIQSKHPEYRFNAMA